MAYRIILADDHKIVREGLASLLRKEEDIELAGEAEEGRQAVALVCKLRPDLVILDISMPGLNGMEAARQMLASQADLKVVALSMHRDTRYVVGMLKAGARGYLLKDCAYEELAKAVRTVLEGRTYLSPEVADVVVEGFINHFQDDPSPRASMLSPREREVLQLLAEGMRTSQIAEKLNLSVKTVEAHRRNIMQKLSIKSVAELTKFALREGITSLED